MEEGSKGRKEGREWVERREGEKAERQKGRKAERRKGGKAKRRKEGRMEERTKGRKEGSLPVGVVYSTASNPPFLEEGRKEGREGRV